MAEPHLPTSNPKGLRYALLAMVCLGLFALAYVILQSISVPKNNLERFAEGSLKKLVVLENPPKLPTRKFSGPNNQQISLADFEGKTILLNVWATWCAPCIAEIPSLDQLQKERGGTSFDVVAISQDRFRVDAESFFKSKGIENLKIYHDNTLGLASDVGVSGLPISIFYGPNGQEFARIPGEVNWQSAEAEALLNAILLR